MESIKTVTLISYCKFWKGGAGFWARTRALICFLAQHTDVTVVYTGFLTPRDYSDLQQFPIPLRFVLLVSGKTKFGRPEIIQAMRDYVRTNPIADTYIVDKTEQSYLLSLLPSQSYRVVDTHDLISVKSSTMKNYDLVHGMVLTEEQEIKLLRQYDGVICIQEEDRRLVTNWLGNDNAILASHPPRLQQQMLRKKVTSIGFVASRFIGNTYGLNWFLDEVWPAILPLGVSLDLYGYICLEYKDRELDGVKLHGFVDSLEDAYSQIDIVINPVRFGAGLKIKSVEAIASGLPLVATIEGARGLASLDSQALLIARDANGFKEAIIRLIESESLRQSLGTSGFEYAQNTLTPHACFGELLERINAH
jgi:glycosyltransferase involved in cell wall biosynthesis